MTKKHFIAVAALLRSYAFTDEQDRVNLSYRFADLFSLENARFDRARFLQACGLKGEHND